MLELLLDTLDRDVTFAALKLPLDVRPIEGERMAFHQSYLKPQKYNRRFDEKFTFVPASSYTLTNTEVARNLAKRFSELIPSISEIQAVMFLRIPAPDADDGMLPPHVDYGRMCAVNVYLKCSGETTQFYTWDTNTRNVVPSSHFVAEPMSCWLLDTSIPHAVRMKKGCERFLLTFSFSETSFNAVKAACAEAGLLL